MVFTQQITVRAEFLFLQQKQNHVSFCSDSSNSSSVNNSANIIDCNILTLKALIMTAADDIYQYFFIVFQRK